MTRLSIDQYFLNLAAVVATRATCLRRQVGCVLVNERGHVLATGYNGRPSGWAHCNRLGVDHSFAAPDEVYPDACAGAGKASGTALDLCEAIHAEQNALLQCHDVYNIKTCYVTVSPCVTCVKLLLNTSCQRIIFIEAYPHEQAAKALWQNKTGAEWLKLLKKGELT